MNVLSLRRIHKDHIIGAFQFPQDLRSITLQQSDPVFPACLTSDMSATEIGNTLQEKGLVRDGRLFALQYLLSEYKKDWKPGTYELSTAMTAEEMMEVMAGQTESATEETVETIDNGSAITGETQDTTAVAQ